MTNHIQFEAKKHGLRQSQDGAVTISLNIHPNDVDPRLLTAPMGKVYQVVMVDADDIQTTTPEKSETTLSQLAALVSQDPQWNEYVEKAFGKSWGDGAENMRIVCSVKSRSEIKEGTPEGERFKTIRSRFYDYKKYGVV